MITLNKLILILVIIMATLCLHARSYEPIAGRWISRDPIKGKLSIVQSINRYQFCYNNPLRFIDPDGRTVTMAGSTSEKDRNKVLGDINSLAKGTFGWNAIKDSSGNISRFELVLLTAEGAEGYSSSYRDQLTSAIQSEKDIRIELTGQKKYPDTAPINIAEKGEGYTIRFPSGADVLYTGKEVRLYNLYDIKKNILFTTGATTLMHEMVGHAIPWIMSGPRPAGTPTGNAIINENRIRAELRAPYNQQREIDARHVDFK